MFPVRAARRICRPRCCVWQRTPLSRSYASVNDKLSSLPPLNSSLHGFTLNRIKHVPELELAAAMFRHEATGAEYLHLARDDSNNVFSIGFKTNAPDATGVPHILEHVTLCGSEKYPVRDPFFKMLPRSLQNFMNAFTASDYTMYPFATTNTQDFKNLMSVYLDATLNPLLKKSDFDQEAWRIGPADPLQDKSELVFKGVVYNEMKGQLSDASYLFYTEYLRNICPDMNNSGGDPKDMTNLTYDQLRNFHKAHYHPSNAKIMTYGDQPVQSHLEFISKQLEHFKSRIVDKRVVSPVALDGTKSVQVSGPRDPLMPQDRQYKISRSWYGCNATDLDESFALQLLSSLLLDGYGSAMYRALIESGLGTDFTPNTGYDTLGLQSVLTVGLNGVAKEDTSKVAQVIIDTMNKTVEKGFDKGKIEGILHQLELALKHKTARLGMGLIQKLSPGWFSGVDPMESLSWNAIVERFQEKLSKDGRYLENLLRKYCIDNNNTFTFVMAPDEGYNETLASEEADRLVQKVDEATKQTSVEDLRDRELALLKEQDAGTSENLDSLPTLRVSDIPRRKPRVKLRESAIDNHTKVQWHEAATNGLTYFTALSMFKNLPDDLRELVPLFCDCVMRIGTRDKTMEEIEDLIKLKTGGISFGYHSTPSPSDTLRTSESMILSGFALDRNIPDVYELLCMVLNETDFDSPNAQKMVKELVTSEAAGALDAIASSGHSYAMRYAEAGLTPFAQRVEQTRGLTQVKIIRSLADAGDDALAHLIHKLKTIQVAAAYNMSNDMRIALTCGADATVSNEKALHNFLSAIRGRGKPISAPTSLWTPPSSPTKTVFPLPYQVYYSALAIPTTSYTDPQGVPNAILAKLLTHKHLHHEIREKGGAYGGGAYNQALGGVFGMYAYRDPSPENSLRTMQKALQWAAERKWTDRELEEAKLSVFQGLDAPKSVNQEGMEQFLRGVTVEDQDLRREKLLDVTASDVIHAAERLAQKSGNITVLGQKKDYMSDWTTVDIGV
ncbi:mitochondrial presequence protease [Piedraia hortae CBS 480.64]|uniref:Presequence protease, mitochondrial n=1 Tax=Piedraia hortae CBS 480.64 TaxID=1314780 RepID=A0A6A7CAK7_9PEZI|nr:mitochondrial presequence protease [Piedraia hortae CBS 480.64]